MFQLNTNLNCIEKATKLILVKNEVTEISVIRFFFLGCNRLQQSCIADQKER